MPYHAARGITTRRRRSQSALRHLDTLFERIVEFAGRLSQSKLTSSQTRRLSSFLSVINHVQNVSETIRVNLLTLGREWLVRNLVVSEVTAETLEPLRLGVISSFDEAMDAFAERDRKRANKVRKAKDWINHLARVAKDHLAGRLTADLPNREWTYRLESELVENLKRLYYFSKRIAREVNRMEGKPSKKSAA